MFKSTLVFLSLSAVLQLIGASSVTITEPKANDVWKAGSTVQIKWDVNDATSEHIRLQYASGPSQSLTIDGLIADNVKASVGHYKWKVPSDIEAKDYVIEAGPNAKDLSFAGYVTIKGGSKKTTTKKTKKTIKPKKTTKKTTTKKTTTKKSATKKTTTKKTTTKKTTTKKSSAGRRASAVCVGYPAKGNTPEHVRCHSLPHTTTKKAKKVKKTTSKKSKKSTKKHTTKKATN